MENQDVVIKTLENKILILEEEVAFEKESARQHRNNYYIEEEKSRGLQLCIYLIKIGMPYEEVKKLAEKRDGMDTFFYVNSGGY